MELYWFTLGFPLSWKQRMLSSNMMAVLCWLLYRCHQIVLDKSTEAESNKEDTEAIPFILAIVWTWGDIWVGMHSKAAKLKSTDLVAPWKLCISKHSVVLLHIKSVPRGSWSSHWRAPHSSGGLNPKHQFLNSKGKPAGPSGGQGPTNRGEGQVQPIGNLWKNKR